MAVYAAWKKLDHPYSMTRQAAQCVEAPDGRRYLNQFDLRGELLFQARAGADGAPSHHSTGGDSYFIHSKISEEFLQELRGRWPDDRGKYELNRRRKREHPSLWRRLQTISRTPPEMETPHPRSHSEEEKWDAIALAALRSPNLVSPPMMASGIEALANCSEKEARAIFRLFAALIFVDPRLAAMLPEDLDLDGTCLNEIWDSLMFLADLLRSRGKKFGLLGIRGNFFAGDANPLLTHEEKGLVQRLNAILADGDRDIWHEWHEAWRAIWARCVARPADIAVPAPRAEREMPHHRLAPRPWRGKVRHDKILILTPIKDAADLAESYCRLLACLSYPSERLSLGMLESDSLDGTYEAFNQALTPLRRQWRRVELWKHDYHYRIPAGLARWEMGIQLRRRRVLAQSRNELLKRALKDEDWALWLDVDVIDYPHDIIEQLLSYGKDILHPHCVFDYGGQTCDRNAWREQGRVDMSTLRGRELLAPLDAVGGTMLFIRADLHRKGLIFPPKPYGQGNPRIRDASNCYDPTCPGELETEGLGIMASDMNVQCWGLPELEILHRKR